MIDIAIKIDATQAKALLGDKLPKALPYAVAGMLTKLAVGGREAVQKQMPVDFQAPTAFTLRGVRFEPAKPNLLQSRVLIPDSQPSAGKSAREYMQPGVSGATKRRQKRTEFLLSRMGFLPPGWVTTPGTSTTRLGMIDSSGNLKPRYYAQIVNVLQIKRADVPGARGVSARSQARAAKMGVAAEFFAVTPGKNAMGKGGSWLPPGVYRRAGRKGEELQQILKFVKSAAYRPRLDFEGSVRRHFDANVQRAWEAAAASTLARFNVRR